MAAMRLAGVHVAHLVAFGQEVVEAREDVVAEHDRDFEPGRQSTHFARAGDRVDAAGVGDDFDLAFAELAGDARDQGREVASVAEVRVGLPLLLQDRHGDLGEVVEGQVVDRALLDQADGASSQSPQKPWPLAMRIMSGAPSASGADGCGLLQSWLPSAMRRAISRESSRVDDGVQ